LLMPLNRINGPISNVAIPALSRLADSPKRYRDVYLRVLEKVVLITMPLIVFMISTSDWLVKLLLGNQWSDASSIFLMLSIAGLVQPIANTTGWLLISQGRSNHIFQWSIAGSSICVASFLIGLPWGAKGVAASYSLLVGFILLPVLFWFVGRTGPVQTKDFYRTAAPIAFASLAPTLVLTAFRYWYPTLNPIVGCGVAAVLTATTFLAALYLIPEGRYAIKDLKDLAIVLKSGKSSE